MLQVHREQYQDHYTTLSSEFHDIIVLGFCSICFIIVFRVSNESVTLDDFLRGDKEAQKEVWSSAK